MKIVSSTNYLKTENLPRGLKSFMEIQCFTMSYEDTPDKKEKFDRVKDFLEMIPRKINNEDGNLYATRIDVIGSDEMINRCPQIEDFRIGRYTSLYIDSYTPFSKEGETPIEIFINIGISWLASDHTLRQEFLKQFNIDSDDKISVAGYYIRR